jgi:hypothetical protein
MSTPSPPHVPRIPPGRAPHLPQHAHFTPPPFQPAATWSSSPFWHPPPPATSAHAHHLPPFGHLSPQPSLAFAHHHHPPPGGFSHLPSMPTNRPQAPWDREAQGALGSGHLPPPPSPPFNDNDNL